MIDILNCRVEGTVAAATVFEVKGTYDDEEFYCRVEIRLSDPDPEEMEYESLDGADLGPEGFNALEELLNEILETDAFQEALEELGEDYPPVDEDEDEVALDDEEEDLEFLDD